MQSMPLTQAGFSQAGKEARPVAPRCPVTAASASNAAVRGEGGGEWATAASGPDERCSSARFVGLSELSVLPEAIPTRTGA